MSIWKNYFKPQSKAIASMMTLKAVGTGGELLIPMGFVYMMDHIVPRNSVKDLVAWGVVMVGMALFTAVIGLLVSHMSVNFGVRFAEKLREDLFEKTTHLDCEQVDEFGISSLTSRLTMDISMLQNFITKLMTKGIRMLIIFVGSLASITYLDPKLAMIMCSTVPFIAVTVYFTTKISFVRFKETKKSNDLLSKSIRDNVMGIRVVKALSKSEFEKTRFDKVNLLFRDKSIAAGQVNVVGSPLMNLIVNFGMVGTLLLGAYWVKVGESSPASIIAFMSYSTMILSSMVSIGQFFTSFSRAGAASSRISEVLTTESKSYPIQTMKDQKHTTSEKDSSIISFENVSFSYPSVKENRTLSNITFTVKEGETLGLIGLTGSGKSTLFHLLLRLYEPDEGRILVRGKDILAYTSEELYQIFSVVFQSDVIFADTIANNISFGRTLSQEQVEFAAKTAQAQPFIEKVTGHYEGLVNVRGQNISGGEKQRLLISRALAGESNILLLDDSTSALDYRTDANLRRGLEKFYHNTTKLLISQRVSSIMSAEQILVLEKGMIIAKGNHEELMNQCPTYQKIATLQLGDGSLYT